MYPNGKALRAWGSACSTGEEVYSMAITFKETLAKLKPFRRFSLQIFAIELDVDAIVFAIKALYPQGIEADVSPVLLEKYFIK